ncbi:Hsp20/alpha crystallin family protein [Hyalangium minutum]|uniref:Heat shock protein, family protein n=1 Tax=Hyalangium minutum TaxID=394096 RepID=A0A085WHB0_9BACT|nr:Hsp20/alpha crystallin family protein [Hyalangium minutum]KFE67073.1 heat shock protein, family protein [Hyalangium minutum]
MAIIRRGEAVPTTRRSLLPWDLFQTMREMLNLEPMSQLLPERLGTYVPAFDVWETKDAYVFKADVPGFREQDLDIQVTNNRLTLSGKREAEQVSETDTYYCSERSAGTFTRTFSLPVGINADQIRAELKEGILTVNVPKTLAVQPKRIAVQGTAPEGKVKA